MIKHPTIDICVLTHNNEKLIKNFLEHLYRNTKDFNLIVLDNNSKDLTKNIIRNRSRVENNITLIESTENLGVAGGRVASLQAGRAEYCICLDSDQFPINEYWLNDLFAIHNKSFDIVGVDAWAMNPPTHPRPYYPRKHCRTKFDAFTYVGGGGTLVPRRIYEQLNFYDTAYSKFFFEDSDFSFSAIKAGYKITWHYAHNVLHLGNQTGKKQKDFSLVEQFNKSYNYFVKKWMPYFPPYTNVFLLERILPDIFSRRRTLQSK